MQKLRKIGYRSNVILHQQDIHYWHTFDLIPRIQSCDRSLSRIPLPRRPAIPSTPPFRRGSENYCKPSGSYQRVVLNRSLCAVHIHFFVPFCLSTSIIPLNQIMIFRSIGKTFEYIFCLSCNYKTTNFNHKNISKE